MSNRVDPSPEIRLGRALGRAALLSAFFHFADVAGEDQGLEGLDDGDRLLVYRGLQELVDDIYDDLDVAVHGAREDAESGRSHRTTTRREQEMLGRSRQQGGAR